VSAVVISDACVRVRVIVNVLAAVELAVCVWVAVSRVPTRQELRVHVVRPLREQRPAACAGNRTPRTPRKGFDRRDQVPELQKRSDIVAGLVAVDNKYQGNSAHKDM
jgi:hypothetical protein